MKAKGKLGEERIFHIARRMPDEQLRIDYLDQICAGDDHDDPEFFRRELDQCVKYQKEMVRLKVACISRTEWHIEGSRSKGKKMEKEQIDLMLRAFNGECNSAISKVRSSNYGTQERKIRSAFERLNKLGETKQIFLQPEYLSQKLQELRLASELDLAKQEQKEREREIRQQIREEAKAEAEIKKAQEIAESEERIKTAALEKARQELSEVHGKHNEKLAKLIVKLEIELQEAIDRKAKAIARAQLTRSGHVYILSNIGTMGEGVYKIGMTRRLIPDERVKELGDASVPFPFDVHAMIYCEDAPTLEKSLHNHFDYCRVNKVNMRKEYFRTSLQNIIDAVGKLHTGAITFVVEHPAEQFRASVAMNKPNRQPTFAAKRIPAAANPG